MYRKKKKEKKKRWEPSFIDAKRSSMLFSLQNAVAFTQRIKELSIILDIQEIINRIKIAHT